MGIGFEIWLFAVAIGASALGGALGMAGGIFIVPLLTMVGGVNIHTAVAASIVSVIAYSCGSAARFLRDGFTTVRIAIVLETATTAGALTGVYRGWRYQTNPDPVRLGRVEARYRPLEVQLERDDPFLE